MFKVVADQLRISEGWVRCGQCDVVFDANAHLQPYAAIANSATKGNEEPELDEVESVNTLVRESASDATVGGDAHEPALEVVPTQDLQENDATHSFLRKTSKGSGVQSRLARGLLGLLLPLLLLLLLLQVVVQERDRLAASEPGAKPYLLALCKVLECDVEPLRHIESVVIDSSSFVNVRADVYRLNFTLKNSGMVDVAAPALELSLTDLQDQTLIRRVIVPSEFSALQSVIPAGAELNANLPISVKLLDRLEKYSGYRLRIFYP